MESYCSSMNCSRNNAMRDYDSHTGNCNRTVQSQNRMAQQRRRQEQMEQYRKEERMEHHRREERAVHKHDREDRNCNRNVEVECVCQVTSDMDCHRHDDMETLGCQFPVVMSYVPWQQWGDLYEPECGLMQGTIFKDLNFIFCGERC